MQSTYLCPYLAFDGDCKQAMEFYTSCLGGKLSMQTYGEAPMPSPDSHKSRIMHAMLENDSLSFMASDAHPGMKVEKGNNVHLSIVGTDDKKIRDMFEKLSIGGTVTMKLEKQFWGDVFGMLTDKFGMHWMFNIGTAGMSANKT